MPGFPFHFTRALFLITEITRQKEGGRLIMLITHQVNCQHYRMLFTR
jgi:uncharacterized protein (UPF0332 family)